MKKLLLILFTCYTAVHGFCQGTLDGNIVIKITKEISWTYPSIVKPLGISEVIIKPGIYTIVKDSKNPYGKVELNIIGDSPVKLTPPNNSFILSCHVAGGNGCNDAGFNCLVMFPETGNPLEKIEFTPIYEKNRFEKLSLTFLSEGITNGNLMRGFDLNKMPPNPFEKVGLLHNQILELFAKSKEFEQFRNSAKKDIRSTLKAFFKNNGMKPPAVIDEIANWRKKNKAGLLDYFKQKTAGLQYDLRQGLLDLIYTKNQYFEVKTTAYSPKTINWPVFSVFEYRVLSATFINLKQRESLLKMAAGARYSISYWHAVKNSRNTPWIDNTGGTSKEIDWDEVAAVDAMGCIAGPEAGAAASIADYLIQLAE